MPQVDDLSRSLTASDQDSTLIAAIEMSLKSWFVAGCHLRVCKDRGHSHLDRW
jgi:hypothetical protein